MTKHVKMGNASFPPEYQEFLQRLESMGFGHCVLRGGALRDSYLGVGDKIRDWDIWADYGNFGNRDAPLEATAESARTALAQTNGISDVKIEGMRDRNNIKSFKIVFQHAGHEIDLYVENIPFRLSGKIADTDAPINSIGMNSKGEVFCHPDFISHARNKIYEPMPHVSTKDASERVEKLSRKISGLTLRHNTRESALAAIHAGHLQAMTEINPIKDGTAPQEKKRSPSKIRASVTTPK